MSHDELSERFTFRLSRADRELIDDAAEVYRMEPGRMIRRLVLKGLRDPKDDIEKRRAASPTLPF